MTIVAGLISYFMLIDFPKDTRYFTREECEFMIRRIEETKEIDNSDEGDSMAQKLRSALSNSRNYFGPLIFFG